MTRNLNREVFSDPAVVEHYDLQKELQESERVLFQTCLKQGMAILDIGVGAGRTTPYLLAIAGRYVGVDYSEGMIAKCRRKFPEVTFLRIDASDMSVFPDKSFDAAVFSFNGIDCLPDDQTRAKCLLECARVLRPDGILILSSHNARYLFFSPILNGVGPLKKVWRLAYAVAQTLRNLPSRILSSAFWQGVGYIRDPLSCGGIVIYTSMPEHFATELRRSGFSVTRILGAQYPLARGIFSEPWYYYACVKSKSRDVGPG
jgi:ubiquinone/menaquinone biosynthesis C-methylase UbiE